MRMRRVKNAPGFPTRAPELDEDGCTAKLAPRLDLRPCEWTRHRCGHGERDDDDAENGSQAHASECAHSHPAAQAFRVNVHRLGTITLRAGDGYSAAGS